MKQSESIANLAAALSAFQASVDGAKKTADNPYYKSKYADLGEIWKTIRKPLTDNGLSVIQGGEYADAGMVSVETMLVHTSGEWISGVFTVKLTKDDAQGAGSAITYARRYGLSAILGVHQEDDDANTHVYDFAGLLQSGRDLAMSKVDSDAKKAALAKLEKMCADKKEKEAKTAFSQITHLQDKQTADDHIPKPASEPVKDMFLDDVEAMHAKILKGIGLLASAGIDQFNSGARVAKSTMKHLGTKLANECNDLDKLNAYYEHLLKKYQEGAK